MQKQMRDATQWEDADLSIGAQVGSWDLQGDFELRVLAHLLGQKVGLSDERVGLHYVLPQFGQALLEQLIPVETGVEIRFTQQINKWMNK